LNSLGFFFRGKKPGFLFFVPLIVDILPHRGEKTTARLFGIKTDIILKFIPKDLVFLAVTGYPKGLLFSAGPQMSLETDPTSQKVLHRLFALLD